MSSNQEALRAPASEGTNLAALQLYERDFASVLVSLSQAAELAFVCPALVKAAIDGRLPRGFGVKRLMDLPMAWPDQWSALGLKGTR